MKPLLVCAVILGCSGPALASGGHAAPALPASGENTFSEDRGLQLSATVLGEMGIRIAPVAMREVSVSESEIGRVLTGGRRPVITLVAPASRAAAWRVGSHARVSGLSARVRANQGGEVIIEVETSGDRLKPGTFVPVRSAPRLLRGVLLPESAIVDRGSARFAYVRNEQYLKRVPVTVGRRAGGWIEITDGLLAGDEVAIGDAAALWIAELRAVTGGGRCCPL